MADNELRERLVAIALEWQDRFGVASQITTSISEFDAAMLIGMLGDDYSAFMQDKTAVAKGSDFEFQGVRYQVKGNRPSGKPGSKISMVPKATNYDWDVLIWVMYDKNYVIQEAWAWDVDEYRSAFHTKKRLSPSDYRLGEKLA